MENKRKPNQPKQDSRYGTQLSHSRLIQNTKEKNKKKNVWRENEEMRTQKNSEMFEIPERVNAITTTYINKHILSNESIALFLSF